MTGEYFALFDTVVDHDNYRSDARTISVFNSYENKFSRITLLDALNNCDIFDKNGNIRRAQPQKSGRDTQNLMDDLNDDFLSRRDAKTGDTSPVKFVGDMSLEFMGIDGLRKAGKTLAKSIFRPDEIAGVSAAINAAVQFSNEHLNTGKVLVASALSDHLTAKGHDLEDIARRVMQRIDSLSGGKALLSRVRADYKTGVLGDVGSKTVSTFLNLFIVQRAVDVEQTSSKRKKKQSTPSDKGKEEEDYNEMEDEDYQQMEDDDSIIYDDDEYETNPFRSNNDDDETRFREGDVIEDPKTGKSHLATGKQTDKGHEIFVQTTGKKKGYEYFLLENGKKYWATQANSSAKKTKFENIRSAFLKALVAAVPEEHRDSLRSHINDNDDAMTIADNIRSNISALIGSKTSGLRWKNVSAMSQWFDTRVEQYENAKLKVSAAPESIGKMTKVYLKKTSPITTEQYGWALPGKRLPVGWQYVHEASKTARAPQRVGSVIPGGLRNVTAFQNIIHAQQSVGSNTRQERRGPRDLGSGRGWADVGQLQFAGAHAGGWEGDTSRRAKGYRESPGLKDFTDRHNNLGNILEKLASSASSALYRVCAMGYLTLPMNKDTLKALVDENIVLPLGFIAFKPHIQYKCRMGIKMKRGGGAINMFMGKGDLQIQHSAKVKTGVLHWTGYMGPVCHTPKNVYVQGALMTHGYDGGDGMQYWKAAEYKKRDKRRPQKDIIIAPVPYIMRNLPNPIDISGRFHAEAAMGLLRRNDRQGLHYPSAPRMNAAFGFHNSAPGRAMDSPGIRRGAIAQNTKCWAGHMFLWNPHRKDFSGYRPNTGHRSKNVYAGMADVWDGSKAEPLEVQTFAGLTAM
jgi:hypothetical protein